MGRAHPIGMKVPRLLARPTRATRARLVYGVLLAFALRALIPLGFMPASDGTLSLMICPGGLPAWLLQGQSKDPRMGQGMDQGMDESSSMPAHPHPGQGHGPGLMDEGYCTFTTGFSSAPPPLLLAALVLLLSCVAVIVVTVLAPGGIRLVRLPPARAPPAPI